MQAHVAAVHLPPNPVWRSYAGGRVLRQFRGLGSSPDDHFPEDWLASTVRARNGGNSQGPNEGLSWLDKSPNCGTLVEALQSDPRHWFGPRQHSRQSMGVLWKLLDSSVRLQLQAHPDASFARKHLGSTAGKTECWYILGTRGDACVYLGFQRPPSRESWGRMIREQRVEEMLGCFDPIPVRPGDCFVVPAGTPHAIGAGVFMVELMEPTDWVVRCEQVNAGIRLSPEACFMGLSLETCLEIFDYRAYSREQVRDQFQQSPRALQESTSFTEHEIISAPWHEFFCLHRLRGSGAAEWPGQELMLLIVITGAGQLVTGQETRRVKAGETWLLPGAADTWRWLTTSGEWELLLARLPTLRHTTAS